jgi:molybdate transport system substrate-binding protein
VKLATGKSTLPSVRAWAALASVTLLAAPVLRAQDKVPPLTIFAAADLSQAFGEIAPLFEQVEGTEVRLVFGSTGTLALQIEHGAPADLFFAANVSVVDRLREQGLVVAATERLYARGRLVIVTSAGTGPRVDVPADLTRPEVRGVVIADPERAPYGQAAREALKAAGVWDAVSPKLVYAENIHQALQFVQSGAADAGITALSVARVPNIRFVMIDERLHRPINQAAAVVTASRRQPAARDFLAFVNGPRGRAIMTRYGFMLPDIADGVR